MRLRPIISLGILICVVSLGAYVYTHPNIVKIPSPSVESSVIITVPTSTSTATSTKTVAQKTPTKITVKPIITQTPTQVSAPIPLQVKKALGIDSNSSGSITVEGVIERTNYERAQNGIPEVTESAELDASAQVKAEDMLTRQYFEHTAPDGKTVSDLVDAQGYQYLRVGENLAEGDFTDNVDLLTAWMNSPGHRANILDARFQNMGVGVAYGMYQGRYVVFAVQHFGRPLSACPEVDASLKTEIGNMQTQTTQLSAALDILKAHIDDMRTKGEYVDNTIIDAYNNSVNDYDALIKKTNDMRDTYNAEVKSFNACLAAL